MCEKHEPRHQNSAGAHSQPQPRGGEFFPTDFTIIKESLDRQTGHYFSDKSLKQTTNLKIIRLLGRRQEKFPELALVSCGNISSSDGLSVSVPDN